MTMLFVGLIIGAILGVCIMSLLSIAKEADEMMEDIHGTHEGKAKICRCNHKA